MQRFTYINCEVTKQSLTVQGEYAWFVTFCMVSLFAKKSLFVLIQKSNQKTERSELMNTY
jgi:hypothetical protein